MSTQGTAVASGARSVAVAGDVVGSVIVTGDHARVELQLGPESGALIELLRKSQTPVRRLRPLPLADRPAPFADHVDRERETSQLLEQSDRAGSVNLHGPAGIGKTYVLHRAAQEPGAGSLPDGIVYLFAKNKTDGDLLQELFEAFYECLPPYRAPATEIRADLRERRGLVLVDSLELERDEAQAWLASAPGCRFLVASRERRLWEGASFTLGGLADADALSVLEAELGRPVAEDERAAAAEICRRTAGNPLLVRQAAARARETGRSLRSDDAPAPSELSTRERNLLAMLGAVPGASVGEERLAEAAGEEVAEPVRRLERLRFVRSHSPRYSLEGDPGESGLTSEELERGGIALLRAFASWAERERRNFAALLAEADAIVGLVRWGMRHDRDQEALRLARAADAAFAWARRFGAWGELIDAALHAARRAGDRDGEAWALHQSGTRAFALGDRAGAIASLKAALSIRRELGDDRGSRVTQHNLKLVSRPAWYLRLVTHAPVTAIAIIVAVAALILAGGGGAATWLLTRGHHHTTVTLTVQPVGGGRVTGGIIDCPGTCTQKLKAGNQVELTATAAQFDHWEGINCANGQTSATCSFSVTTDTTAAAVWTAPTTTKYTLTVNRQGDGSVSGAIACPGTCAQKLKAGQVQLTASQADFDHWNGVTCANGQTNTTCTFNLKANTTVTAVWTTPPTGTYTLTVQRHGNGSISGAITCPGTCTRKLKAGTIKLTATAAQFDEWSGVACAEGQTTTTCTFSLNANTAVTAVWNTPPTGKYTLTVNRRGDGSVSGDITCPGTCAEKLKAGKVKLTATAAQFDHWDGVTCAGGQTNTTCVFPLTGNTTVTAVWVTTYALHIEVVGGGKSTVSVSGAAPCQDTCDVTLDTGVVTLTANNVGNYAFDQWTGVSCDGEQTNRKCSFRLTGNTSVTAVFGPAVQLTIKVASGGTVTSDPAGIQCRPMCRAAFAQNSVVTLTARADDGYEIAGWGRACSGIGDGQGNGTGTCKLQMDKVKSAYVKFAAVNP